MTVYYKNALDSSGRWINGHLEKEECKQKEIGDNGDMGIDCAADTRLKPLVNTQEAQRTHAHTSRPIPPITSIPTSPFITQARINAAIIQAIIEGQITQ